MKSLTRTIIVLIVFNLTMGNLALAEKESEGKLLTYTISGTVGLSGVVMKGLPGKGLPGIVVTDENGYYSATVEQGWTGRIRPVKEGFIFEPASMDYRKITSNRDNQNYVPKMITFTISGRTGLNGVEMQGLPGNPVTDEKGYYSAVVAYGWSGTVTPTKEGYGFKPTNRPYSKVTHDQANQYYIAEVITCTISNVIMIGGSPIQGVRVEANNGGGSDITDAQGRFSVKVPYGWSGEITLSKEGFQFPSKSYTNITENYRDDFPVSQLPVSRRGRTVRRTGGRKVLVIPDTEVKPEELDAMTEDLQIMSHIFDERFKEPRTIKGVFVDFGDFFGRDSRETEAIYMQGYGALFLMEVNFAFSPPLKSQEHKDEETAEYIDPDWQRAKQRLFSPRGGVPGVGDLAEQESGLLKVEELKTELTKTLKHASNIRNMKQDEWVIFTVFGKSRQGEGGVIYFRNEAAPGYGTSRGGRSSSGEGGGYGAAGGSVSYGGGFAGGMMGGMGGMMDSGGMMGGMGGMMDGGGMMGSGGMMGGMGGYGGGMMGGMGGYGGGMMGGMGGYGGGMMGGYGGGMGGYGEMIPPSATVLTIRAKKSDVDAFAKGEIDFEQFQQKVEIFTY